ncbi:Glycine cleavage system H protein [Candidatus Syntrophocurvum alkaliphilum]|uniref:Glycine cleavage system H protein n=1 Tax=Candidatus Syntrophocurvum alkaliphilum TaxID=2293317 RepID=A0A6I6DED4_9FIRM|nr:glycine cleavage system protein GcvH [Candidatus Syntrophocurvum alkaliphilum]QGT98881.1 Glycine cleavage system H protein [Candidatus Syntrophocurvum alkaliphilum]
MNIPKDLYYSEEHEWVRVEEEKVYIGITDYAQSQLGDIVFVELPMVDEEVEVGGEVGVIESVKAVSDMYSPVSGKIVEVNEELETSPELLNEDCYQNFILVVQMDNPDDINELMSAEKYEKYCSELED